MTQDAQCLHSKRTKHEKRDLLATNTADLSIDYGYLKF